MNRRWHQLLAVVLSLALLTAACGGDDDVAAPDATTTTSEPAAGATVLNLLISDTGLEGLPQEIPGGVVTVSVGPAPGAAVEFEPGELELDFTLVDEGTTEEEFTQSLAALFEGGPFADFIQNSAGVGLGEHTIELPAGSYIVWFEFPAEEEEEAEETTETTAAGATTTTAAEEEEEEEPPDVRTATLTVTEPVNGGEFPETDGTITATDYDFDVEVSAGDSFTFRNDSTVQFHHAILFDFGTLEADTVEENLPAFLESGEEAPPPPAFEGLDFENLFPGRSGFFGPGLGGTFTAPVEGGNTYAVVCFIQDRDGGPPHAFAYDMYEVFQIG